ncbi:PREDICTED: uncharacterized protein LOC109472973 [Branchiostoma belcheri]|uniref:Uncharacterized protein LOC109472973 n=1 Tax=Branchiostoma belcheri TaxID=7741 RepID=A0A6P4YGK8_BRABE|nr:PREDICTED: uncharacterized protein LOC109472973 [Branchiostoma belcheri]
MPQSLHNSAPFEPEKLVHSQEAEDSPFLGRNAGKSTGRPQRISSGQQARSTARYSEKTPLLINNGGQDVGLQEFSGNSRKPGRRKPKKVLRQLAMKRQSLDATRRYFHASGEYSESVVVPIPTYEEKDGTKQSRHLPKWAWFLVAKSLGIKLKEKDRPWFGTFLYLLTLTSGLALGICTAWRTVVDILDIHTSQNAIDGTILVLLTVGWISVGVYANDLAFKLFSKKHFYDSVRVHSKTIFKINAALLVIFLCTVFGVLTNYNKFDQFLPEHCEKINLNPWICYVMYVGRVVFSLFCLGWNAMVATICLSMCRTHTIAIRKFIKDLEEDGMAIDTVRVLRGGQCQTVEMSGEFGDWLGVEQTEDYIWDDTHEDLTLSPPTPAVPVIQQENQLHQFPAGATNLSSSPLSYGSLEAMPVNTPVAAAGSMGERSRLYSATPRRQQGEQVRDIDRDSYENSTSDLTPNPGARPTQTQDDPLIEVDIEPTVKVRRPRGSVGDPGSPTRVTPGSPTRVVPGHPQQLPQILANGAILHTYWRIQTRLRFTSSALQRWLASWITLTIFWCITYILNWLKHEASIPEMFEFLLPLLTLPILCSAVAEVNGEGVRVSKQIVTYVLQE